jgi:hypothetical protein
MNLDDTVQQSMALSIVKRALVLGFTVGALFSYPLSLWSVTRRIESIMIQHAIRTPRVLHLNNDEETLLMKEDTVVIREYISQEGEKYCSGMNLKRNMMRIGLVIGTEILAIGVPSFTIAIAFIGSTFGIALMLIVCNARYI